MSENILRPVFGAQKSVQTGEGKGVVVPLPVKSEPAVAAPAIVSSVSFQQQAQWANWFVHTDQLPAVCMTPPPRTAKGFAPKKPTPPNPTPPGRPSALRLVQNNDLDVRVAA